MPSKDIHYSDKYTDDTHEYRHVTLPSVRLIKGSKYVTENCGLMQDMRKKVPTNRLMTETEWRKLGVQQSPGWIQYMIHEPEPHILLFKRALVGHQPKPA